MFQLIALILCNIQIAIVYSSEKSNAWLKFFALAQLMLILFGWSWLVPQP